MSFGYDYLAVDKLHVLNGEVNLVPTGMSLDKLELVVRCVSTAVTQKVGTTPFAIGLPKCERYQIDIDIEATINLDDKLPKHLKATSVTTWITRSDVPRELTIKVYEIQGHSTLGDVVAFLDVKIDSK